MLFLKMVHDRNIKLTLAKDMASHPMIFGIAAIIRDCTSKFFIKPNENVIVLENGKGMLIKRMIFNHDTPFLPMYSAIWPLAIAPIIAPTFDKEPNKEN